MNRSAWQTVRATIAACALLAVVIGVPIVLAVVAGWPLPRQIRDLDTVRWRLENGQIPDETVIKAIAVAMWIVWAQLAVALVAEAVGAAKGTVIALPFGFRWAQRTMSGLTATVAVTLTLAQSTPGLAQGALERHADPIVLTVSTTTSPKSIPSGVGYGPVWHTTALDTLWGIAERTMGDGARWGEIRDLNAGRTMTDGQTLAADFTSLRAGWTLQLPHDAQSDSVLRSVHTVAPGESFWTIAENELEHTLHRTPTAQETANYWHDLVERNTGRLAPPHDPNIIHPGETYELPSTDDSSDDAAPPATAPSRPITPAVTTSTSMPTTSTEAPHDATTTRPTALPPTTVGASSTEPIAEASDAPEGGDHEAARIALAALGGCAVLTGGVLLNLKHLRRRQRRRRHPHTELVPRPANAATIERILRTIADNERTIWLDATLRYLSAQLEHAEHPPALTLVRVGPHGAELVIEEAATPPAGFIADADGRTWRLDPALDLDTVNQRAGDAYPYAPALVTIGRHDDHEILIDLEAIDTLVLHGKPADTDAVLRALALGANTSPWGSMIDVVTIGVDAPPSARCYTPKDPTSWAHNTLALAGHAANEGGEAPQTRRLRPGADPRYPVVVLLAASYAHLADDLATAASLPGSTVKLVAAADIAAASALHLVSRHATLEPLALDLTPVALQPAGTAALTELVEHATYAAPPVAHETALASLTSDAAEPETLGQPSAATLEAIERLSRPGPVEVRILGRQLEVIGACSNAEGPNGRVMAAAAYLAYHRRASSEQLRVAFWPTVSARTFANNMARVRKLVGVDEHGKPRLSDATNAYIYELSDDVTLDWHRMRTLIDLAENAETDADIYALLHAAIAMVNGVPLADAPPGNVAWLLDEPDEYPHIEAAIVDVADRLAALAVRAGDIDVAEWAISQGLTAAPATDALLRMRLRMAHRTVTQGSRPGPN